MTELSISQAVDQLRILVTERILKLVTAGPTKTKERLLNIYAKLEILQAV